MVIIAGDRIEMTSRSLQLRDRYFERIKGVVESESRGE